MRPLTAGPIGTAAPLSLVAASPAGDWVALCQARSDTDGDGLLRVSVAPHGDLEGDRMALYFIEQGGEGEPIDAFIAADPSGRYVSFVRAGRVILRDTHAQRETDLSSVGADPRNDLSSYLPHRAGSFHPHSGWFAYLRLHGERTWLIQRELQSGTEKPIDPGSGLLWRAGYEADGAYLRLRVVNQDTNGNRKLGWSSPPQSDLIAACPSPLPRFAVAEVPGDSASDRLYRLSDGKLLDVQGFVMTVGNGVLTRNEKGELWLSFADGEQRLVSSEECKGRVLHARAESDAVLIGCAKNYGERRDLVLRTKSQRVPLKLQVAAFETDGRFPSAARLLVLNPGNEAVLIDMNLANVVKLAAGTTQLASFDEAVLAQRQGEMLFLSAEGAETKLGVERPKLGHVEQQGQFVTVGALWFNLKAPGAALPLTEEPLALARNGAVLLFSAAAPRASPLVPNGPLTWRDPRVAP